MTKIYLALHHENYKLTCNPKSWYYYFPDKLIKAVTSGQYTHCEIAIQKGDEFDCYSATVRDKGVRKKTMKLNHEKWALIDVSNLLTEQKVIDFYEQTKGDKYDFVGAVSSSIPFWRTLDKWFCSEWCFACIMNNKEQAWRFSPNDLLYIFGGKEYIIKLNQ